MMRGGEGPPGEVSIWSWSPLLFGCPLNLVLYMPFRIFAYSSNILKTNFDLMGSCSGYEVFFLHGPSFARLTYWSVTELIRLNSRMTSSPPFVFVVFLIANLSGCLFHSLSIVIVSSVVPAGDIGVPVLLVIQCM